jgi:hypothetical protein
MSVEPFIVYEPPYGGQALRLRGARAAWNRVKIFLETCTDASVETPKNAVLQLFEPSQPDSLFVAALDNAKASFGQGRRRAWSGGVRQDFLVEWHLSVDQIPLALTFIENGEPWPKSEIGPIEMSLSYDFQLVDPATRAILPGQTADRRAHQVQAHSNLIASLGPQNSAILVLRLPFASPDSDFVAYVESIVPHTPVKLLPHGFRHWVPTKKPSALGYRVRRVSAGLLDGIGS